MKKISLILLASFLLASLFMGGCGKEQATFPNQDLKGNPTHAGKIETVTIQSQYVGAEKKVEVYLPYGYDASKKYPVIYFLHGFGGNENSWFQGKSLNKVADELIQDGTIQPVILVCPNAENALGGSFYTNSIDINPQRNPNLNPKMGFGFYEYYFIKEVIPTIESKYSIDGNKRAIEGHSMGGYGAMKLAMLYPTLFKSVVAHSGPLSFHELFWGTGSNLLQRIAAENDTIIDPAKVAADPFHHVITVTMMGMASAFSPHFGPALSFDYVKHLVFPAFLAPEPSTIYQFPVSTTPVDTAGPGAADDILPGIDVPVRIAQPHVTADTVTSVVQEWMRHDCYTMLQTGKSYDGSDLDLADFKKMKIYMDCGNQDDFDPMDDGAGFGIIGTNIAFDQLLTQKGIDHVFNRYTGAHSSDVYYRIEVALKFQNAALK